MNKRVEIKCNCARLCGSRVDNHYSQVCNKQAGYIEHAAGEIYNYDCFRII